LHVKRDISFKLTCLYNCAHSVKRNTNSDETSSAAIHGLVFAQLVSYIEDAKLDNRLSPVFKLSDIAKLYAERLRQLGLCENVHSTRLKQQLLAHFPDMRAQEDGRDILLLFSGDIGPAVLTMHFKMLSVCHDAQIIRQQIFSHSAQFDGSFGPDCQEEDVPKSLLALVNMMLEGPNTEE